MVRPASAWSPSAARRAARAAAWPELGELVYASRLLGADATLVLAGGGNTSAKGTVRDLHGEPVATLFVKGSGSDLASAGERDFTPLALAPTLRLLDVAGLSDHDMMRALARHRLDSEAPPPSVEALLHAFLPFRFVLHAHPDALLAAIQTADGDERAARLYGDDCLLVPYVKPGFDLALACRRLWNDAAARGRRPRGMILLRHGVFAFADEARAAYETLLELVARARRALPRPTGTPTARRTPLPTRALATLRAAVSRAAGRPMLLALDESRAARAFVERSDLGSIARRGTLTPDHVLRTKRLPLLLPRAAGAARIEAAVARYVAAYGREFERLRRGRPLAKLDSAPRVVLVPGAGILGVGRTAREAAVAAEIYVHTAWAIARAEALGGFRPLGPADLFEVEYWELEQAKLARAGAPKPLAGRVALVSGAASGIGRACAIALAEAGAAIVGLDLVPMELPPEGEAVVGEATDPRLAARAVERAARRFGGLDILVSNVGIFFAGPTIEATSDEDWRRTQAVNVDSHFALLRAAIPLLRLSPAGGSVVVVGSKNVAAPGPGAAAYSASKAALTQLARVAALELAADGIRVNLVHPDAVFDTGVWTPERLAERAARYGLTVEQYRRRNLLGREVASVDVARAVVALAGDLFSRTTGAQIPVDGGNERVI